MRTRWDVWACALLAGSASLPGLAATATLVVDVAQWPVEDDGAAHFGIGVAIGGLVWAVASLAFCRGLTTPGGANRRIHGELRVRIDGVAARFAALARLPRRPLDPPLPTLAEVRRSIERLRARLGLAPPASADELPDPSLAWLMGHGYVAAWAELHRVEELVLRLERLRARTDEYRTELERSGVGRDGQPGKGAAAGAGR